MKSHNPKWMPKVNHVFLARPTVGSQFKLVGRPKITIQLYVSPQMLQYIH